MRWLKTLCLLPVVFLGACAALLDVQTAKTGDGTILGHYVFHRTDTKGGIEGVGRDLFNPEGKLVDVKFATGPTVVYGVTAGTGPAAAGATGFALGMKFLRPTEINETTSTNVSGVSSSDQSQGQAAKSDSNQSQQMQQQQKQKGGDATASPTVSSVISPTVTQTNSPTISPSATASPTVNTSVNASPTVSPTISPTMNPSASAFGYGVGGGASATANPTISPHISSTSGVGVGIENKPTIVNKPTTNVGVGIGIGVDNKNINVNDNYNKNQATVTQPPKKCGWC